MTPSADVLRRAARLVAEGQPLGLATIVATRGSTPQKVGARLLVARGERAAGTLGGGSVEAQAAREAWMIAAGGRPLVREYVLHGDVDTWGHACAGSMVVLLERVDGASVPWIEAALAGVEGDEPVAVVTALDGPAVGARALVRADGRPEALGGAAPDAAAVGLGRRVLAEERPETAETPSGRLFAEPFASPAALVILGAGHVGKALAGLGRFLGVAVTVVDDRPEYASRERFPEAAMVVAAPVRAALGSLPISPRTAIVVAMRDHELDYEATAAALATPARFVGLLGARRKAAMVTERLLAAGMAPERVHALRCPVGLDIGARTPEEIAVSIVGEWLMARERSTGARTGAGAA